MRVLALALFGGLIFGASVPPCRWSPLAYLGVALLFIANMRKLRWEKRVLAAMVWGLSASILPISFSIYIAKTQGATYPTDFDSWLLALMPFLFLSLVVGIVSSIAGKLWQSEFWQGSFWVFGTAALGVIAERLTFLLPIPLNLAATQTNLRFLILPLVSFTGVWGVSWLVWFVAAAIAEVALNRRKNFVTIGTIFAVTILSILGLLNPTQIREHKLLVAAVQNELEEPLTMLRSALKSDGEGLPSLIVLPELSLGRETPFLWRRLERVFEETRVYNVSLVAGLEESNPPFNSAILVDSNGKEILRYRKVHLFGAERWRYLKGHKVKVANDIGIAICFDTVFPDVVRKLARQSAKVVAVPNNDPVTVGFLLHHLHAAFFKIRAAENGVSIVKADTMGLSQLIDCDGSVVAEAPLGKSVVLKGKITVCAYKQGKYQTLYTRLGDWFLPLCAIIAMSLFVGRFLSVTGKLPR